MLDSFNSFLTERGVGNGLLYAFIWANGDEIVAQVDFATGYLCMQCIGHVEWFADGRRSQASDVPLLITISVFDLYSPEERGEQWGYQRAVRTDAFDCE